MLASEMIQILDYLVKSEGDKEVKIDMCVGIVDVDAVKISGGDIVFE